MGFLRCATAWSLETSPAAVAGNGCCDGAAAIESIDKRVAAVVEDKKRERKAAKREKKKVDREAKKEASASDDGVAPAESATASNRTATAED